MKKIVSLILILCLSFGTLVLLTGCGAPKDGGPQIKVYLGDEIYDFDPTDYYADDNAAQLMRLLFEPLFSLDKNGKLSCAAAQSYRVDKEEREIVISLRESYWSDSVRVKAEDFIYAWRDRIMEPNNANPAAALFYDIEGAVEVKRGDASLYTFGASATGLYEITIRYREGADPATLLANLSSVATSPVREDLAKASSSYWTKQLNTMMTNGPFAIRSMNYETGEFAVRRNIGYHQKTTEVNYVKEVTPEFLASFWVENVGKVDLNYAAIENNTLFFIGNASTPMSEGNDLLADRKENAKRATVVDTLSTYTYVFNTENPLFADKNVRRALSLALDREAMAKAITFAKAATGFLPDTVIDTATGKTFRKDTLLGTGADLTAARAALAAAEIPAGVARAFTLTVQDDAENRALAALAKAAWEELGFTVTVKYAQPVTHKVYDVSTGAEVAITDSGMQTLIKEASVGKRDFDVIGLDWQMYSRDAMVALSAFTSDRNGNGTADLHGTPAYRTSIGGYTNTEYDKLISDAFALPTKDKGRADLLRSAEKLLLEDMPVIPVLYGQNFAYISNQLSGVKSDAYGNFSFTKASLKNYRDRFIEAD